MPYVYVQFALGPLEISAMYCDQTRKLQTYLIWEFRSRFSPTLLLLQNHLPGS